MTTAPRPIGVETQSSWDHHTLAQLWGFGPAQFCPLRGCVYPWLWYSLLVPQSTHPPLFVGGSLVAFHTHPPPPISISPHRSTIGTRCIDIVITLGRGAGQKSAEARAMLSEVHPNGNGKERGDGYLRHPLTPPSLLHPWACCFLSCSLAGSICCGPS